MDDGTEALIDQIRFSRVVRMISRRHLSVG